MELQRFKDLSLQNCNSEAKVKARSQDLPGALAQQFWSRGRAWLSFQRLEGPWRSRPWTSSLPRTVLFLFEGSCSPEQWGRETGGRKRWGSDLSKLRSWTLEWRCYVLKYVESMGSLFTFLHPSLCSPPQTSLSIFIQINCVSLASLTRQFFPLPFFSSELAGVGLHSLQFFLLY